MREYHKIKSIYKRDINGSKKLLEGNFESPTVEYLKNNMWEFTEKVDGMNIRINWDGHKVSYSGRTDKSQLPSNAVNLLLEIFGTEEAETLFEQVFGEREVFLFCEAYGGNIQKVGKLYSSDVRLIMFDLMISGNYQSRKAVESTALMFGLECVPIVFTGTLKDGVEYIRKGPQSFINEKAPMEGLVARPVLELQDRTGNRIIVKIKARDFK